MRPDRLDRRAVMVGADLARGALALGFFLVEMGRGEEARWYLQHAPGQLGEKTLGEADAPVTVVEYASMSCPHCAQFDATTFDDFRLKYVDTGKVRYIFREFPLNAPAFAGRTLGRAAEKDVRPGCVRVLEVWRQA